jgi:hypothetical protein
VPGFVGQRVVRSQIQVNYEFGGAAQGSYDDMIVVSVVSKRLISTTTEFVDYDGAVAGGTGRFTGATGRITASAPVFESGTILVKQGVVKFQVWVPRKPPVPKGRKASH